MITYITNSSALSAQKLLMCKIKIFMGGGGGGQGWWIKKWVTVKDA